MHALCVVSRKETKIGREKPKINVAEPRIGGTEPRIRVLEPRIRVPKQRIAVPVARIAVPDPRNADTEPRSCLGAKTHGPGARNRCPGTENCCPGTKTRCPCAKNPYPGAKNPCTRPKICWNSECARKDQRIIWLKKISHDFIGYKASNIQLEILSNLSHSNGTSFRISLSSPSITTKIQAVISDIVNRSNENCFKITTCKVYVK